MTLEKHSITLQGHSTSFTLEPEFWIEVKRIAASRSQSIGSFVSEIDQSRDSDTNLSSALRLAVLKDLKSQPE